MKSRSIEDILNDLKLLYPEATIIFDQIIEKHNKSIKTLVDEKDSISNTVESIKIEVSNIKMQLLKIMASNNIIN